MIGATSGGLFTGDRDATGLHRVNELAVRSGLLLEDPTIAAEDFECFADLVRHVGILGSCQGRIFARA